MASTIHNTSLPEFKVFSLDSIHHARDAAIKAPFISTTFMLVASLIGWLAYTVYLDSKKLPGLPLMGEPKGFDFRHSKARAEFSANANALVEAGLRQFKNKAFQVMHHSRPVMILPVEYFDEIRNDLRLDMNEAATEDFFTEYPPFASMRASSHDDIMVHTVQQKLTPLLMHITSPVNEENNIAIPDLWPAQDDFTPTSFVQQAQLLVAQVSSRVFLGAPLCRDANWIQIARDYTIEIMTASIYMQHIPRAIRPLAWRFLPPVHKLNQTLNKARSIIEPEVHLRRKAKAEALARGEKIPKQLDAIDWMDDLVRTKGTQKYDFTGGQLGLTFAAIHTTSLTLTHLLYDILENPELIPALRQEIVAAYTEDGGWEKTTLYKLRLMDSVMKESQRMNCLGNLPITRIAKEDVKLSNGTVIKKGVRIMVPALHLKSSDYYSDPSVFDGRRFLNLREQPGNQNKFHFVTTSIEHNAFGHGKHACPGRFFASNEIKLILSHLLIKFDWQFVGGVRPPNLQAHGGMVVLDPKAKLLYRSRKPEVDF